MATKIKAYNKSLSARIKRRNKQGFSGVGTPSQWTKRNSFGNYRDVDQSHRDSKLRTRNISILCEAMKIGVVNKHPGSKPISKVIKMLRSLHISTALHSMFEAMKLSK